MATICINSIQNTMQYSREPADQDTQISQLSDLILRYRFSELAIFVLEVMKPLAGISNATALLLQPLIYLFRFDMRLTAFLSLLGDREQIEKLIQAIELKITQDALPKSDGAC